MQYLLSQDEYDTVSHLFSGSPKQSDPQFPVWKTVKVGGMTLKELKKSLKDGDFKVSEYAEQIMENVELSKNTHDLDLILVTPEELGFPDYVSTEELYKSFEKHGLKPAPVEAALQLRLEYTDQPLGECLYVMSKPVAAADGDLQVLFVVCNSDGSWVYGNYACPDDLWFGVIRLLLCRK